MALLIETERVTRQNLLGFLGQVEGCWKFGSLLWMQANGFPVLLGLVVDQWSSAIETAVSRFCSERHLAEFLVRLEKPGQRWTRRRGGYTIPVSGVRAQLEELSAEGMLTALLEPASPYQDMFSLASVCDLETGKVDVEVVGTGFDASDVLRADALPHERFEVSFRGALRGAPSDAYNPVSTRVHVVEPKEYRESVRRRLVKIGARLVNPAFPDAVLEQISEGEKNLLAEKAARFLRASGQGILLQNAEQYQPIPSQRLNIFLRYFYDLAQRIKSSGISWRTISLAASFQEPERLILWDFFPPGETDTSSLSRL